MVDDAPVTTGLRSRRALETLAAHDPQFVELVKTLYGDVDVAKVWTETFGKNSPDGSSLHVPGPIGSPGESRGRRWALRVGLAGTAAGGAISLKEGGVGLHQLAHADRIKPMAGRFVPKRLTAAYTKRPKLQAAGKVGASAFAVGADLVAGKSVHAQQRQAIAKGIGSASVEEMAKGFLVSSRRLTGDILGRVGGGGAAKAADTGVDTARAAGRVKKPASGGKHRAEGASKDQMAMFGNHNEDIAGTGTTSGDLGTQATGQKIGAAANLIAGTPKRAAVSAGVGASAYAAHKVSANKAQAGYYQQPAYYSKRHDVEWEGTFAKLDDSKHLAFGWANVCKIDGELITDKQGDIIDPDDLEDAAYDYVLHSRTGGDMHLRTDGHDVYPQEKARPGDWPIPVAEVVESMMFTAEKKEALGLPDEFPEGWWIGMKYHDEDVWQDIQAGRRAGFSVHGSGSRVPA
jgi:hypothetical protein